MFAETVNLLAEAEKLAEYWSPRVVAEVNGQYVKVAKVLGDFAWHNHRDEDELFHILKGTLRMDYEDRSLHLPAGTIHVVPRGVMHKPYAEEECWMALVEPAATRHTGDVETPFTKSLEEQLK